MKEIFDLKNEEQSTKANITEPQEAGHITVEQVQHTIQKAAQLLIELEQKQRDREAVKDDANEQNNISQIEWIPYQETQEEKSETLNVIKQIEESTSSHEEGS